MRIISSSLVDEKWNTGKAITKIEFWKYNPMLFARNGVVDPVSLYKSLQGNEDERIESELERMIVEYSIILR